MSVEQEGPAEGHWPVLGRPYYFGLYQAAL